MKCDVIFPAVLLFASVLSFALCRLRTPLYIFIYIYLKMINSFYTVKMGFAITILKRTEVFFLIFMSAIIKFHKSFFYINGSPIPKECILINFLLN